MGGFAPATFTQFRTLDKWPGNECHALRRTFFPGGSYLSVPDISSQPPGQVLPTHFTQAYNYPAQSSTNDNEVCG